MQIRKPEHIHVRKSEFGFTNANIRKAERRPRPDPRTVKPDTPRHADNDAHADRPQTHAPHARRGRQAEHARDRTRAAREGGGGGGGGRAWAWRVACAGRGAGGVQLSAPRSAFGVKPTKGIANQEPPFQVPVALIR